MPLKMCAPESRAPLTTPGVSAGSYWSSPIDSSSVVAGHQLVLVGVVDVRLQPGGDRRERGRGGAARQRHRGGDRRRCPRSARWPRRDRRSRRSTTVQPSPPPSSSPSVVSVTSCRSALWCPCSPVVPGASVPADAVVPVGASVLGYRRRSPPAPRCWRHRRRRRRRRMRRRSATPRRARRRSWDLRRIMVLPPGGRVGGRRAPFTSRRNRTVAAPATAVRTPAPPRPPRLPRWRGPGPPPACRPAWARSPRSSGRCA